MIAWETARLEPSHQLKIAAALSYHQDSGWADDGDGSAVLCKGGQLSGYAEAAARLFACIMRSYFIRDTFPRHDCARKPSLPAASIDYVDDEALLAS